MNRSETAHLLAAIRAMYQNFHASEETVAVWSDYLGAYPPEAMVAALKAYIDQGQAFPPNAGQLVALVRDAVQPALDPELEAARMWDKALTFIRGWAPQHEGAMDSKYPILGEVIRMVGGWTAIRAMDSEDVHRNTRPHFLRLYAAKIREGQRQENAQGVREAIGEAGLRRIGGAS